MMITRFLLLGFLFGRIAEGAAGPVTYALEMAKESAGSLPVLLWLSYGRPNTRLAVTDRDSAIDAPCRVEATPGDPPDPTAFRAFVFE